LNFNNYKNELDQIRANRKLLAKFSFDIENINQAKRLRLCIACFNDFNPSDYDIAYFLFQEESKWRKTANYYDTGDLDVWYFSALVLTLYRKPEIIFPFFEAKMIDFDATIGFDGEYLLSAGIRKTFDYLETSSHPLKDKILKVIGPSYAECNYETGDIEEWEQNKRRYFAEYIQ